VSVDDVDQLLEQEEIRWNNAQACTDHDAVAHIHDCMPVILPLRREKTWLLPNPPGPLFIPRFPPEALTSYPVTPKMNKASFNSPEAILHLEPALQ
jgi:putative SOS response-associated peptidase YedK